METGNILSNKLNTYIRSIQWLLYITCFLVFLNELVKVGYVIF